MKTFFDGIFVNCNNKQNENEYPIKLEYYKTIKTEESVEAKYGIEIVDNGLDDVEVNGIFYGERRNYVEPTEYILHDVSYLMG